MIVTMILLQVFMMPAVGAASLQHVYFSVGQGWMGAVMGAAMAAMGGLLALTGAGHLLHAQPLALWEWLLIGVIGVVATLGYRYQLLVGDREWMHDMIPHHSMALTTSAPRLQSSDPRVARLAQEIILAQTREIGTMKELIKPPASPMLR